MVARTVERQPIREIYFITSVKLHSQLLGATCPLHRANFGCSGFSVLNNAFTVE